MRVLLLILALLIAAGRASAIAFEVDPTSFNGAYVEFRVRATDGDTTLASGPFRFTQNTLGPLGSVTTSASGEYGGILLPTFELNSHEVEFRNLAFEGTLGALSFSIVVRDVESPGVPLLARECSRRHSVL